MRSISLAALRAPFVLKCQGPNVPAQLGPCGRSFCTGNSPNEWMLSSKFEPSGGSFTMSQDSCSYDSAAVQNRYQSISPCTSRHSYKLPETCQSLPDSVALVTSDSCCNIDVGVLKDNMSMLTLFLLLRPVYSGKRFSLVTGFPSTGLCMGLQLARPLIIPSYCTQVLKHACWLLYIGI